MSNYRPSYDIGQSGPLSDGFIRGTKRQKLAKKGGGGHTKASPTTQAKFEGLPDDPVEYYKSIRGYGWQDKITGKPVKKDVRIIQEKPVNDAILNLASKLYISATDLEDVDDVGHRDLLKEMRGINDLSNLLQLLSSSAFKITSMRDPTVSNYAVEEYIRVRGSKPSWEHMELSNHPFFVSQHAQTKLRPTSSDFVSKNINDTLIWMALSSKGQWSEVISYIDALNRALMNANLNTRSSPPQNVAPKTEVYDLITPPTFPLEPKLEIEEPYVISTMILMEAMVHLLVMRSPCTAEPDGVTLNSSEKSVIAKLMKALEERAMKGTVSIGLLFRVTVAVRVLGNTIKGSKLLTMLGQSLLSKQDQFSQTHWAKIILTFSNIGQPLSATITAPRTHYYHR